MTYANVASTVALVIALTGGTVYAAKKIGPSGIANNAVRAKHIKDGEVKGPEVDEATLSQVPSAKSADAAANASAVSGLTPGQLGSIGRSQGTVVACTDDDHNGTDCATQTLSLPRSARVFALGFAAWNATALDDLGGTGSGGDSITTAVLQCRMTVDGAPMDATISPGLVTNAVSTQQESVATAVSSLLPAGSHTFAINCTELDGDVSVNHAGLSVVTLGSE